MLRMRSRIMLNIGVALVTAVNLAGQSAGQPLAFEVASIRATPKPWHVLRNYTASGPRLTLEGYNAVGLIMEAYNLKNYQLTLPKTPARGTEADTFYNITAKAEVDGTPTKDEFRRMLQTLLVERFHLKFHRERKELPVYALVLGKNGPKFKESAPNAAFSGFHGVNGRNQNMTLTKANSEMVAAEIENDFMMDRPVLNETGLTGTYDIKLEATPEFKINSDPQPGDVSIFTAVQEKLGLKLEARKAEIEVVIVDRMERPTEN
jgi:uncharacterized protein (TIGR03435 family)